jgi:hypothetical protein
MRVESQLMQVRVSQAGIDLNNRISSGYLMGEEFRRGLNGTWCYSSIKLRTPIC